MEIKYMSSEKFQLLINIVLTI